MFSLGEFLVMLGQGLDFLLYRCGKQPHRTWNTDARREEDLGKRPHSSPNVIPEFRKKAWTCSESSHGEHPGIDGDNV